MNKVHLVCDHEWTLAELASIACLSKYHILSVFQSGLGETPGQFVHPIRLERAARLLIYNRLVSITDVAHTYGFSSSQALPQAFQSRFRATPSAFRRANVYRVVEPPHGDTGEQSTKGVAGSLKDPVKLVERPS